MAERRGGGRRPSRVSRSKRDQDEVIETSMRPAGTCNDMTVSTSASVFLGPHLTDDIAHVEVCADWAIGPSLHGKRFHRR